MIAKQIICKDMDIDIKGITLLSREEFEKNKEWIPATFNNISWWLRSKGCCDDYVCYVDSDNLIHDDGYVDLSKDLRPVLLFNTTTEINPGDEFLLFARDWVVLETSLNGNFMAISLNLEPNGNHYFNEYGKSNDYENSIIKEYLEEKLKSWIECENR